MAIKLGTNNNETLNGTAGWDALYALAGNDMLFGGTGRDILSGGDGNDTLEGGAGGDSLHGGAGADVFKYSNFNHVINDKITDFSAEDKLDFSAIANAKFIGNAQFNGVAGEIRYYKNYVYTYLSIDTDGDAEGDVSLSFSGSAFSFTETASNSKILTVAANQTINGTAAAESLVGDAGNDTIIGADGNDRLTGGEGNDVLQGGDGNDVLVGGLGNDKLTSGAGADTFRFNSPDDFLLNGYYYSDGNPPDTITDFSSEDKIVFNFQGISFIGDAAFTGTPGQYHYRQKSGSGYNSYPDLLEFDFDGDKTADQRIFLSGLSTAEIILEEKVIGSNQLTAAVSQNLIGTSMAEILEGGNGNDTLNGNAGDDSLVGGASADTLNGGEGNDVFKYNSLTELGNGLYNYDYITDLAVGDEIDLSAIAGLSFVGVGNDFSGVANQVRTNLNSSTLNDRLQIDTNGDKVPDYVLGVSTTISINNGGVLDETIAGSNIFQIVENKVLNGNANNNTLVGGSGYDTLNGNAGNDSLIGGASDDTLDGGNGDDILVGGASDDILNGGDGNDVLIGGLGTDRLTGGLGNDVFKFNSLDEFSNPEDYMYNSITDFTIGDEIDLSAIVGLSFVGIGNDFSGVSNQVSIDYYGSDSLKIDTNGDKVADYVLDIWQYDGVIGETAVGSNIFQIAEDKILNGTTANNTLTGGNGNDTLNGLSGNDSLIGAYGSDILDGGNGADILIGGLGADELRGGSGNDVFKFNSIDETHDTRGYYDTIIDFATGDKINLSRIDANAALAGNQAFSFVGSNSFTGVAGELKYQYGTLYGNVNGDTSSDFYIDLTGSPSLTTTDFVL